MRLAFTSDTAPGEVTANAAVVQRRGGDGEWIGQSNDYRFRVGAREPAAEQSTDPRPRPTPPPPPSPPPPDDQGTGIPFADELAGTGLGRVDAALGATALLVAAGAAAVLLARRRR